MSEHETSLYQLAAQRNALIPVILGQLPPIAEPMARYCAIQRLMASIRFSQALDAGDHTAAAAWATAVNEWRIAGKERHEDGHAKTKPPRAEIPTPLLGMAAAGLTPPTGSLRGGANGGG